MPLPPVLQRAALSGSAAAVVSAAILVARGKRELDAPAAPLNAPSQWIWGKHAPYIDRPSLRHTAAGYAIHHLAAVFWACFHELALAHRGRRDAATVIKVAAGTTATAAFVDYCLTPERLTPGFQKRLSLGSLVMVYAGFAAGLASAALLAPRRR